MPITLGGLTLPGDLHWKDEFAWSPVQRSAEYSLTGALIVQESVKQAGRPITLEARSDVWLTRSAVRALQTLAETPGWSGTLTLADGRAFTVAFREEGLSAEPVRHIAPTEDADPYTLTLALMSV